MSGRETHLAVRLKRAKHITSACRLIGNSARDIRDCVPARFSQSKLSRWMDSSCAGRWKPCIAAVLQMSQTRDIQSGCWPPKLRRSAPTAQHMVNQKPFHSSRYFRAGCSVVSSFLD